MATVPPNLANPGFNNEKEDKLHGFLSRQFPTIANPAPLGLCGFALTTFVLSCFNAGIMVDLTSRSHGVVMGLALFYGGLCQLLAGMWEIQVGNTFGGLAFSSYGGFWMSFAALFVSCFDFLAGYKDKSSPPVLDTVGAKQLNDALGVYLLAWCIFSGLMTIAAHRTTLLLFILLFTVFVTFLLLSISKFSGGDLYLQRAGGIWGFIAAILAWYGAFAALLTKKTSLFVLPLGNMDPLWRKWGYLKDEPL